MNRARDSSETRTARSVRGLDQRSRAGASEAPRRLGMDQSVACTPSRGGVSPHGAGCTARGCSFRMSTAGQSHAPEAGACD